MYKIFKITYNDGGWHSGDLPHFFYIAESEDDVISNSKKYQEYLERQQTRGGDIWLHEVSGLVPNYDFENLDAFDISISLKKKISDKEV